MATRSLGSLTIDLIAKVAGFITGMDEAERKLDSSSRRMQDKAYKLGVAIGKTLKFAAVGAAAAVTTLSVAVKKSIDKMDDISKSAQKVGTSTENFSTLTYAAKLSDIEMDTLTKTLGKFYQAEGLAVTATSTQARVFKGLKIDIYDANGHLKDSVTLLKELADKYQETGGSTAFMAAGTQLMGRKFQDLIPLMKDGAKGIEEIQKRAKAMGLEISTGAGVAAEHFNDNINDLNGAIEGIVNTITVSLLPSLTEWSNKAVKLSQDQKRLKELTDGIKTTTERAAIAGHVLAAAFYAIEGAVNMVTIAIAAQIETYKGLFEVMNGIAHFDKKKITQGYDHAKNALTTAFEAMGDAGKDAEKKIAGSFAAINAIVYGTSKKIAAITNPQAGDMRGLFVGLPHGDTDILKGLDTNADAKAKAKAAAVDKLASAYDALAKASYDYQNSLKSGTAQFKAESTYRDSIESLSKLTDAFVKAGGSAALADEMFNKGLDGIKKQFDFDLDAPQRELKAYTDTLQDQLGVLREQTDLRAKSVALGDQERANLEELTAVRQQAASAIADYTRQYQLHPDSMSEEQYKDQLDALRNYWTQYERIVLDGQAQVAAAQGNAQNGALRAFKNFHEKMQDVASQSEQLTGDFIDGIAQGFADVASGAKGAISAVKDFATSFEAEITKLIAQHLLDQLFNSEQQGGSGSGNGSWASMLGSMIGSLLGGSSGRAAGGPVGAHGMYRVNELGSPEMLAVGGRDYLLMGRQSGYVKPTTAGAGAMSVVNNYSFAAPTSLKTQTQMAQRQAYELSRVRRLA